MIDILLVEDHRELAQLIVSFLKRDGFQVHHVESGEAALSYLAQTEVRLLLLDIMLPHMDGFTVCKKVREHKAVPILIMSARYRKACGSANTCRQNTCCFTAYIRFASQGNHILLRCGH